MVVPESAPLARITLLLLLTNVIFINAEMNLKYLDPTKLQTVASADTQTNKAIEVINKLKGDDDLKVELTVDYRLFSDKKDVFILQTVNNVLHIAASSGVAAVWGFNYYLKKYCKSHIEWRGKRINIPKPIPEVLYDRVVANDRFRYYQNVCTFSYSFVWWNVEEWMQHVEWMALNGINLVLAPTPQESTWARVYKHFGMTDDEINEHFTGPAFLSWLRMGNVHGWAGPLPPSWIERQESIYQAITAYMEDLGMILVYPGFNGHVPKAFARIFPNTTFYNVGNWNKFEAEYCCGLFLDPNDKLFKDIGHLFLTEMTRNNARKSHIYTVDPFNEVNIELWSTSLVVDTAKAITDTLSKFDGESVWLLQNWLFVHDSILWPMKRVKSFLTAVPNGRLLILDLQSEQWPQYDLYQMYYGHPFIWCMLHNFGGTYGMFGNTHNINTEVYQARSRNGSTMLGIGITPEGINQNYVLYELMLESAWRKEPVDLKVWAEDYAERRYGCPFTTPAWTLLFHSVYDFRGLNKMRGKYVMIKRPSFKIKPWAWYKSTDLLDALKYFVMAENKCPEDLFYLDLVDVTRQVLQYRAEQIYLKLLQDMNSNITVFNSTINKFLDVIYDMEKITSGHSAFRGIHQWFAKAKDLGKNEKEMEQYELNARNQITLWGPNGEITDYAAKQWTEMFHYYYIPRWTAFLAAALEAKQKNETFNEKNVQRTIRKTVENKFFKLDIRPTNAYEPVKLAKELYEKWKSDVSLTDLPLDVIVGNHETRVTLSSSDEDPIEPSTVLLTRTSPFE